MSTNLPDYCAEVSATPYLKHNDIELIEYHKGYCKGRIRIQDFHKNLNGSVHGGCIFSLSDAVAVYTAMTDGTITTTMNASINYLFPVINTEYLYCVGKTIKSGKTVTVVRTELYDDNEKLLAEGSFSCFNVGMR